MNCICSEIGTDETEQVVDDQDEVDKEELHSQAGISERIDDSADDGCECRVKGLLQVRGLVLTEPIECWFRCSRNG